ncbi:hypothetical protein Hdeb2414_s0010g00345941 [Helianthus debilis subsp. tardiflorus]
MSGEASSSETSRKRRMTTRSLGTAEAQQQPADVVIREIRYHGPGIPLGQSTLLLDSPLLQFSHGSSEWARLQVLMPMMLLEYRRIDCELVCQLGHRERLEQLLGNKFRLVLDCDAPQFYELALEFHSMFQYRHVGGFAEQDVVSFSLGKKVHNMTLPQFAVVTRFYTQ